MKNIDNRIMNFLDKIKPGDQFKFFNSKIIFVYLGKGNYRRVTKGMNVDKTFLPIYKLTEETIKNIRSVFDPKRKIQLGKKENREDIFTWRF